MPPFKHFPPKSKPLPKQELEAEPGKPLWPCPNCEGMGRTKINTKCAKCKGTGQARLEGRA